MACYTHDSSSKSGLSRVSAVLVALATALSLGSMAYAEDATAIDSDAGAAVVTQAASALLEQDDQKDATPRAAAPEGAKAADGDAPEVEEPVAHNITVNASKGGKASAASSASEGDSVSVTATPDSGYKLAKVTWAAVDGGAETDITSTLSFEMPNDDVVVTVTFEELLSHKVTVVATPKEGGTATASATSARSGDSVKLEASPAKGYYLVGWKVSAGTTIVIDEDKVSTSLVMGDEDVTVTATFDKDPEQVYYTISFDPNGGKGSMESLSVKGGTSAKLTANAFTRKNAEFIGWNTAKDGTGTDYADLAEVKPTDDLKLYALWDVEEEDDDEPYYIFFDANGGSGDMDDLEVEPGSSAKLTANAYKRSGYTFKGWNTKKDGSGKSYADKASIKPKGDVTLYAQWKKNAPDKKKEPTKRTPRLLPKTGDTFNVAACAAAAIAGCALVLVGRKVRNH